MIGLKNLTAVLALSVAVVAAVSPASAAQKHVSHQARAARAQAVESDAGGENGGMVMNKAREDALRECDGQANKLVQKDWGVMQGTTYAACMTEHGQME